MSKGYGRVERAILHALREQRGNRGIFHLGADAKELAHYIIAGEAIRTVDDPTYYRGGYTPTRSPRHADLDEVSRPDVSIRGSL